MSYPKKNKFTGKPSRRKLRSYNRIARRRRKRGIYKVSRETRRKMSIAQRRRKRDIFKKNPGGKRLSVMTQIIRWMSNYKSTTWRYISKPKRKSKKLW